VHQNTILPDYSNTVKVFLWFHEVLNFMKNDVKIYNLTKEQPELFNTLKKLGQTLEIQEIWKGQMHNILYRSIHLVMDNWCLV
jgi:hypothetical protein